MEGFKNKSDYRNLEAIKKNAKNFPYKKKSRKDHYRIISDN